MKIEVYEKIDTMAFAGKVAEAINHSPIKSLWMRAAWARAWSIA